MVSALPSYRNKLMNRLATYPPAGSRPAPKTPKRQSTDVLGDVINSFKIMINKPMLVMYLILVGIFLVTHGFTLNKGYIYDKCLNKKTPLCQFIMSEGPRLVGLALLSPVVFDLKPSFRVPVAVLAAIAIFISPTIPWHFYAFAALLVQVFFHSKLAVTRALVIGLAFAAYYFDLLVLEHDAVKFRPRSP